MARSHEKINKYKNNINEMRAKGKTVRKISEELGFSIKQIKNFITRYNHKQEKIAEGATLQIKGGPPKDYEITEDTKIRELKYIIARKKTAR